MNRQNYEMTDKDLTALMNASKPTPVMFLSGGEPMGRSQQENANAAWKQLGDKMGFNHMTVKAEGRGNNKRFTAEPTGDSA